MSRPISPPRSRLAVVVAAIARRMAQKSPAIALVSEAGAVEGQGTPPVKGRQRHG
jgi:hypothetical protein